MPRKYPERIKIDVRERIKNGESKISVSQDMSIPYGTILTWTSDTKRRKSYSQEIRQKVRERVGREEAKVSVAEAMDISYSTVVRWTKDITTGQGNRGIRGRTLRVVQDLMKNGYTLKNVSRYTKIMLKSIFRLR